MASLSINTEDIKKALESIDEEIATEAGFYKAVPHSYREARDRRNALEEMLDTLDNIVAIYGDMDSKTRQIYNDLRGFILYAIAREGTNVKVR